MSSQADLSMKKREDKRRGLAYWHQTSSEPLRVITCGRLLDLAVDRWPHREFIVSCHEGISLTFLQFKQQVEELAGGLLKLGLRYGDRLALLGVNSAHWCVAMLAAAKIGLIVVTLNPAYRTKELGFSLAQIGARAILTDHVFKTQDYPAMLAELAPDMTSAPHGRPLSCPQLPHLSYVIVATDQKLPGCYRLDDVRKMPYDENKIRLAEHKVQPDDPVFILFSSGTTGEPKGAVLSHFGVINNVHYTGKRLGAGQTLCLQVPLFHIFGNAMGILVGLDFGRTLILPGPTFNKKTTAEALLNHKCDIIYGTTTMYIDLGVEIDSSPNPRELVEACSHMKAILVAGSYCPPEIIKHISEMFPNAKIHVGYGMTETSGPSFLSFADESLDKKTNTVGCCIDHVEVKIVDKEGKVVNFGTPGEAWFRGCGNMLEYWGNPEKTKGIKTIDGWLKSGDILILQEDGYASIAGRIKDIIIRGGENIYPGEIEELLLTHPDILNAQVYGVADKRMVEEVAASILLRESSSLTEEELREFCKGKICHYKIPKYIKFVDEFPQTTSGKVKKFVLKQILESELKERIH